MGLMLNSLKAKVVAILLFLAFILLATTFYLWGKTNCKIPTHEHHVDLEARMGAEATGNGLGDGHAEACGGGNMPSQAFDNGHGDNAVAGVAATTNDSDDIAHDDNIANAEDGDDGNASTDNREATATLAVPLLVQGVLYYPADFVIAPPEVVDGGHHPGSPLRWPPLLPPLAADIDGRAWPS